VLLLEAAILLRKQPPGPAKILRSHEMKGPGDNGMAEEIKVGKGG
jgi:hypothetical protein